MCIFYAPFFIKNMAVQKSQRSKKKKNLVKNIFYVKQSKTKYNMFINKNKYYQNLKFF